MASIVHWFETIFHYLPLQLLEVWGSFGYIVGLFLMFIAFAGFTFRPNGKWGFGRQKQSWDLQALLSIPFSFVLIFITGYLGSFIVLVPGAQTFESLKDLSVFLCIVLFGYPALVAIPFAYGLSDLIEGVPPNFLLDWIVGYFINPACFWLAYQLIGRNPDFRKVKTWGWYFVFVIIFMMIEPQLWGYICSDKFTPQISYRSITPALFFTTSITWVIAPFFMLIAFPLAKRYNMFWAEIPRHVKEIVLINGNSSKSKQNEAVNPNYTGVPIRIFLVAPIIGIVLVMVGATAYLTLSSAEVTANNLASNLHQEISENINLQLDKYLTNSVNKSYNERIIDLDLLLRKTNIARHGKAFIINRSGIIIASSIAGSNLINGSYEIENDLVIQSAIQQLRQIHVSLEDISDSSQFRFDVVTPKPLTRETWFTQATPYSSKKEGMEWIVITAIPASYYLAGIREGNSKSAMVSAIALTVSLLVAAILAGLMLTPISRISMATRAIALGDLSHRVPSSRLEELGVLATSFNNMAKQLQESFLKTKASEERFRLLAETIQEVFWITNPNKAEIIYISPAYEKIWGRTVESLYQNPESWTESIHPEDKNDLRNALQEQYKGGNYDSEYRILRPDGSIRWIHDMSFPVKKENGDLDRVVGVARDITERKQAEDTIKELNANLEIKVEERTTELKKSNMELSAVVKTLQETMVELKNAQEQLLHTEKLAVLGQLAAGMTHELNTPLGAIVSSNKAILNILNNEIIEIPNTLSSLDEKDLKVFTVILEESLKDAIKPENIPDRNIRKEWILKLKQAGFEDYNELSMSIMDTGIYKLGDRLLDLLQTQKRSEILSVVSFFTTIFRLSSVISTATGKASHVVEALKNYLNPGGIGNEKDEVFEVDIISEIETILTLYHGKIKYGVEIVKNYEATGKCLGNGNKLNQVWINLLNNGLQSMNYKGKLEIEIKKKDSWIVTSFTDSGSGIPDEIKGKIFEPFFTTKKHGEGIGLGLDISKKIIERMGGKIEFESVPGKTKFSVWLQGTKENF